MRLKEEELREIEERANAATTGKWESTNGFVHIGNKVIASASDADAAFIAASRTDIPRLLEHATMQDEELKRMREFVQEVANETTGWGIIKSKARRLLDGQQ